MNKNHISKIADSTNASLATISKVLNHCYGVSGEVRERIYREYDRVREGAKEGEAVCVYVIIPEIPKYFWNLELKKPQNPHITIKYNVYSRMGDHDTVMRYLKEAVACNADVILITAQLNAEAELFLSELADKKLIVFLTEMHDLVNCFYVGSDAREDGLLLAEACLKQPAIQRTLVLRESCPVSGNTSAARLEAFCGALRDKLACDVVDVQVQMGVPTLPSTLARALAPHFREHRYDAVVTMNGYTSVVCAAVQKMKLPYRVSCFGFENAPQNQKWAELGYLKAVVWQDFSSQFSTALDIAEHYVQTRSCPRGKYTILPSGVIEYPNVE